MLRHRKPALNTHMSHNCNFILIRCMDWRLKEGDDVLDWVEKNFGKKYDDPTYAGGVKDLISPKNPAFTDHILESIRISYDLHGVRKAVLMNHTDCGAYGGKAAFESPEAEEDQLIDDLKASAGLIKNRWPDMEVTLVLSKVEGDRAIEHRIIE
ncbi:MAG: carbonic anhydrase [Patescibacteria group bacterium]